jgi:MFS family permease
VKDLVLPRLAWGVCALSLLLLTLSLAMILAERSAAEEFPWQGQAIDVVGTVGAPILGGLLASRRPENPIGWMWLGVGVGFSLSSFGGSYATYALGPGSLPAPRAVGTLVAGIGWTAAFMLIPFLLLLFPTGRLPSRRWRFLAWAVVAAGTVALVLGPFVPGRSGFAAVQNPFGVGGVVGDVVFALVNGGVLVLLAAVVPSALSLVFRYRRAAGVERLQIKWLAYAAVVFAALIPLDLLGLSAPFGDVVWSLVNTAAILGIYAAVGVAILRHRLYNIDVLINRTLVYGGLTASLAAVYLGGVASLQYVFRALTGQEQQPQLVVVVSTLAIAALFSPLRRIIQGFIDRRFYRSKYDARRTLEEFSARLRVEPDLGALGDGLIGVARETVQPAHASLWLRRTFGEEDSEAGREKKSEDGSRNAFRNGGETAGA